MVESGIFLYIKIYFYNEEYIFNDYEGRVRNVIKLCGLVFGGGYCFVIKFIIYSVCVVRFLGVNIFVLWFLS